MDILAYFNFGALKPRYAIATVPKIATKRTVLALISVLFSIRKVEPNQTVANDIATHGYFI